MLHDYTTFSLFFNPLRDLKFTKNDSTAWSNLNCYNPFYKLVIIQILLPESEQKFLLVVITFARAFVEL